MKIYHPKFSKKGARAYEQEEVYNAIIKFEEDNGFNPTCTELAKFMKKDRRSIDQLFNCLVDKNLARKEERIREKQKVTTRRVRRKEYIINKQNNAN